MYSLLILNTDYYKKDCLSQSKQETLILTASSPPSPGTGPQVPFNNETDILTHLLTFPLLLTLLKQSLTALSKISQQNPSLLTIADGPLPGPALK